MAGKNPMTPRDAQRIQSHADRTGKDQDFKERAQRAADTSVSDKTSSPSPAKK